MIKIKPTKVIIISLSKKQLKEFFFCPLLSKKIISENNFKFKKNHIGTVR